MDGDFQQHYQDAERAYSEGDYAEAHLLASGLLEQLVDQPQDADAQAAVLGWRAFLALLLGHIELYGRDNPSQAVGYYEQVLANQPQDTLAELAQQGLERCRPISPATIQPEESPDAESLPEMLRDPFLTDQPSASISPTATAKATAMPWLEQTTPEPNPRQTPAPRPTPEPTPEPKEIPILDVELLPEATPEDPPPPELVEEDPLLVLAGSLLRVKVNLSGTTTEEVRPEPPRPSWIQQLRDLFGRR